MLGAQGGEHSGRHQRTGTVTRPEACEKGNPLQATFCHRVQRWKVISSPQRYELQEAVTNALETRT